jgi:hypothetical protein
MKKQAGPLTRALGWAGEHPMTTGAIAGGGLGAGAGALLGGKDHRLSGALQGAAMGAPVGALSGASYALGARAAKPVTAPSHVDEYVAQMLRDRAAERSMIPIDPSKVIDGGTLGKHAELDLALGHLWAKGGPGQTKHAAANYFAYHINKDERDQDTLGRPFCKVAHALHQDPWDLATLVVKNYPELAKTASTDGLARFYCRWADQMIKKAAPGIVNRVFRKIVPEAASTTENMAHMGRGWRPMHEAPSPAPGWHQTPMAKPAPKPIAAPAPATQAVQAAPAQTQMMSHEQLQGLQTQSAKTPLTLRQKALGVGAPIAAGTALGFAAGHTSQDGYGN